MILDPKFNTKLDLFKVIVESLRVQSQDTSARSRLKCEQLTRDAQNAIDEMMQLAKNSDERALVETLASEVLDQASERNEADCDCPECALKRGEISAELIDEMISDFEERAEKINAMFDAQNGKTKSNSQRDAINETIALALVIRSLTSKLEPNERLIRDARLEAIAGEMKRRTDIRHGARAKFDA